MHGLDPVHRQIYKRLLQLNAISADRQRSIRPVGVKMNAIPSSFAPNDADRIASLCRRFNLLASMGSDFHDPAVPWNPLGRWLKLAAGLEPVTDRLTATR